jgi:hypothetical protein
MSLKECFVYKTRFGEMGGSSNFLQQNELGWEPKEPLC